MDNVQVPYKVKRLFIDIETSLIEAGTFSLWPKYISHQAIFEDWYIICAAWKWEGNDEVYTAVSKNKNDKNVVKALAKVIDAADEIIYHNGRKFDFKKIHARAIYHRLPPIVKPCEIDTLIQARKHFSFTSNKLDYLATFLNVGEKIGTDIKLWVDIRNNVPKALVDMVEYNKHDVVILEGVFKVMQPYIDIGHNLNVSHGLGDRCPSCGSDNIVKRGFRQTLTGKYQRFICRTCKHSCTSGVREQYNGIKRPLR